MVNSAATLRRQQELQQQQYAIQHDARQQQMQQHTEGNHGAKHAPIKEESHQEGARVRKGWFLKTSISSEMVENVISVSFLRTFSCKYLSLYSPFILYAGDN